MARPLRIEFANALYHVTSRGDRREAIYEDDRDRFRFLAILHEVIDRYNWVCPAYCLMGNHYHLMLQTPDANLSRGMRHLNGLYTQASNRRHERTGHLFQGRYKAILVDRNGYLLELARYIVLNPVRAGLVECPEQWRWSSYRATVGSSRPPDWLASDILLKQFRSHRYKAREAYRRFVLAGIGKTSIWSNLRQQIYLGDDTFIECTQSEAAPVDDQFAVPRIQRRPPPPPLAEVEIERTDRNSAIIAAYATGGYSYRELAEYFGLHLATVGRIVRSGMLQSET